MLAEYRARARAYPPLSREEEQALFVRARAGDARAKDVILCAHLRHVAELAQTFRRYAYVAPMDFVSAGHVGLVYAFERFDHTRGCRFFTFARNWIRAYMFDVAGDEYSLIQAGPAKRSCFFRVMRESQASGLSPEAAAQVLAPRFKMRVDTLEALIRWRLGRVQAGHRRTSEEPIEEWSTVAWKGALADELLENAEERTRLQARVGKALAELDDRERAVLAGRILCDDEDERTLQALGDDLGLCRERIRIIEKKALAKVRKSLMRSAA